MVYLRKGGGRVGVGMFGHNTVEGNRIAANVVLLRMGKDRWPGGGCSAMPVSWGCVPARGSYRDEAPEAVQTLPPDL